jgi:hypothetical protein
MIVASLVCLVAGALLAGIAHRFDEHVSIAESIAGGLLILGLALIGSGLPIFR